MSHAQPSSATLTTSRSQRPPLEVRAAADRSKPTSKEAVTGYVVATAPSLDLHHVLVKETSEIVRNTREPSANWLRLHRVRVSRRIEPLHEPGRTLRPKFTINSIAAGYSGTCPWHQQLDRRREARCSVADRGKFFRSIWLIWCLSSANWTVLSLLDLCTSVSACCQTTKFYIALPVSDFFKLIF